MVQEAIIEPYSPPLSAYTARVHVAIRQEELDIAIIPPSKIGGTGSDTFRILDPIDQMPAPVLADGSGADIIDAVCRGSAIANIAGRSAADKVWVEAAPCVDAVSTSSAGGPGDEYFHDGLEIPR